MFRLFLRLGLALSVLTIMSCNGGKKASPGGEGDLAVNDFIDYFPTAVLPFTCKDSMLELKGADSLTISWKNFTRFVPDSIFRSEFGAGAKPKLSALRGVSSKQQEYYLFMKAELGGKKAGYLICFDKEQVFKAAMPVVVSDDKPNTYGFCTLNTNYSVNVVKMLRNADGSAEEKRQVFVFNNAGGFTLIMTDEAGDMDNQAIINPIDTLPRKNKLSADYVVDKRNYVSVRDGAKPSELMFFVHFEKEGTDCNGELKGMATLAGKDSAVFRLDGDPCSLALLFNAGGLRLRELQGCGSHRGISCAFEGSFPRAKEVKPKEDKTKPKEDKTKAPPAKKTGSGN